MGQRFIWVLFACSCNSSWMPFDPGPFKVCYSVTSAERTPWCAKRLDRGETLKNPFQTAASSWLDQSRDDQKSKTRHRNKHQIIRQIRVDDRSEAPWVTGASTSWLNAIYTTSPQCLASTCNALPVRVLWVEGVLALVAAVADYYVQ